MSVIIVNFYTRSYGDTISNMLAGHHDIQREKDSTIISKLPGHLKPTSFYSPAQCEFQHTWYEMAKQYSNILPAHRQYSFDFSKFDRQSVVISIIPDLSDIIARRIIAVDTWEEKHPILSKFIKKLTNEEKLKYIKKTIEQWTKNNILDSDIKIPLSELAQLKNLNLGLQYNQTIIDGIYDDMKKYVN